MTESCRSAHTCSCRVFTAALDTCTWPNDSCLSCLSPRGVASLVPTPWKVLPALSALPGTFHPFCLIFYTDSFLLVCLQGLWSCSLHSGDVSTATEKEPSAAGSAPAPGVVSQGIKDWMNIPLTQGKSYLLEYLCQAHGGIWFRPSV